MKKINAEQLNIIAENASITKKQLLQESLDFDPIALAEEVVGEKNLESGKLGLALMLQNNAIKNALLEEAGDTKFSNELDYYLSVAARIGFEIVLVDNFAWQDTYVTHQFGETLRIPYTRESQYFVLWNRENSVLLAFDTYPHYEVISPTEVVLKDQSVNGGNFYYNWIPNDREARMYTSSGGYYKPEGMTWDDYDKLSLSEKIFVGYHDCREALARNFTGLKEHGTFVKEWKQRPFFWLNHYHERDLKEMSNDEYTQARIARLPEDIQRAIGPKK